MLAAVLLLSRSLCRHLSLPCASTAQILAATGASKSRAYEIMAQLLALLPTLARRCGRPASAAGGDSEPAGACTDQTLTRLVLRYVMQHPGCVHGHGERQSYSDAFRHFVVELRAQHENITLEIFSTLAEVPLGTMKTWVAPLALRSEPVAVSEDEPAAAAPVEPSATVAQIETVLIAYKNWHGTFVAFTEHVRHGLRVPLGRQLIVNILAAHGVRLTKRREGRSPDELALRGAFETFFPGAQWVGDGKLVHVNVGGESFGFNLELNVDAYSAASVGLSVRDTEDSVAVIESFDNGVITTGAAPLALLLDNKPSNHTPDVDVALQPSQTLRMRATPQRPQNKAHVEGAFGLFAQTVPLLVLDTTKSAHDIAQALLLMIATTWARAINHRPRADRGGRSRVELYAIEPTAEQIEQARRALKERCRLQELARATLESRQCTEVKQLLDLHFERLLLLDPERHVRLAIARYPRDAIIDGIAIFTAKRRALTLPEGVDARYLLGIVRNLSAKIEGEHIAEAMLALRIEAQDLALAGLALQLATICDPYRDDLAALADCIERALTTDRTLDRTFWLRATVKAIEDRSHNSQRRDQLFLAAARKINATLRISPCERHDALRFLADRLVPLN